MLVRYFIKIQFFTFEYAISKYWTENNNNETNELYDSR